jgi:beta-glucanase (GH16 family)
VIGAVLIASTTLLVARADRAVRTANAALSSQSTHKPAPSLSASAGPSSAATSLLPAGHWVLTWNDQFKSTRGLRRWWFENANTGGPSEHELQWYDRSNATVRNGNLVITATKGGGGHTCWNGPCQYSSARMQSTFSQAYGFFEARIKLAGGHGIWPAFWMQGDNYSHVGLPAAGEIDIVEVNGRQPVDQLSGFVHEQNGHAIDYYDKLPQSIYDGYHVYAVEWTPQRITLFVDGKAYGYLNAYRGWPFDHPFNIILSLAVGGGWPHPPDASTHFPASMYVDWLRVYRRA